MGFTEGNHLAVQEVAEREEQEEEKDGGCWDEEVGKEGKEDVVHITVTCLSRVLGSFS